MKKINLNLTVKNKFILIGALTLVSMICVLGLGLYTTITLKNFDEVSISIERVESGMLMLRRNEKDFLARNDLKYRGKFDKNFTTLQSYVTSLKTSLGNANLDTSPAIKLVKTFNAYQSRFHAIVNIQKKIGLHSKDGLYGRLREAVHGAETEIKALDDQHLRADMLQLRRNEKDFMLRNKLKYLDKFNKNIDAFNQDLSNSEHHENVKQKINNLMTQYKNRFTTLVNSNQEKGLSSKQGLMGEMRGTVHKTESLLKTLSKELKVTVESEVGSLDSLMLTTTLIALALTTLLIGLISWLAIGILRPIQLLESTMTESSINNDLSLRIKAASKDEIGRTGQAFNVMLEKFQSIVEQVNGSATQMSAAAEELSVITSETTKEINQQSLETDQVATAINEMAATVQEVASNASDAASAANDSTQQASNGRQIVNDAINTIGVLANEIEQAGTVINKLEEDSTQIGAILDVIKGIAEQTNLLALNAAIEAARAGEQGRGFAVVADEVRTLASRTQESTQEIQQMIESLQTGTTNAVQAMNKSSEQAKQGVDKISAAGDALSTIASGINLINDMNTQIASAAVEQGAVSEEINKNVINITNIAQNTAENSKQAQNASEAVSQLAIGLQALVAQFK